MGHKAVPGSSRIDEPRGWHRRLCFSVQHRSSEIEVVRRDLALNSTVSPLDKDMLVHPAFSQRPKTMFKEAQGRNREQTAPNAIDGAKETSCAREM